MQFNHLTTHGYPLSSRFKHLQPHKYERYLPTAFDESESILEKINKVIYGLNKVIDVVSEHQKDVAEWGDDLIEVITDEFNDLRLILDDTLSEYERFREMIINDLLPESVVNKLDEWLIDGTLYDIINNSIFEDINLRLEKLEGGFNVVDIKQFGAVGDGVTDDSEALRSALQYMEENDGGVLIISQGTYSTKGTFDVPTNTTIEGYGNNSKFVRDDQSFMFRINGEIKDRVSFTQNSQLGDHFVHVNDSSVFEIGDYIRIISQKVASSKTDTQEDYYLGHTTSSLHALYYGEVRQISDISESTGQLFFRGGLIFPDYNTHDSDETDPLARRNATVEKVEFKRNVQFKDLTFEGRFSNVMRFDLCVDAIVENVNWYDAYLGDFVSFHNSLNCQGRDSRVYYLPETSVPNHYSRNAFKTVSSTNCGFDNIEVSHGTQNVDFTYTTSDSILTIPNINSYLTNSRIYAPLFDGMTSHPGSIHAKISDNTFLNCRQDGIFIRTRNAVVSGNVLSSGIITEVGGSFVGIKINQDVSQNCLVEGNNIDGFTVGVRTHDNVNTEIEKLNLTIANNVITRMNRGVQLRRGSGSTFTGNSLVKIVNNTLTNFVQEFAKGIDIFNRYQHIVIQGNTFEFNDNANGGIYSRGDSGKFIIKDNVFTNHSTTFRILWFGDSNVSGISRSYLFKNNVSDGTRFSENNFITGNLGGSFSDQHYHNLMPYVDNTLNMGSDSFRWRTGVFSNGVSQSSDINLKKDVSPLELGSDFIKELKPMQYKMKDDNDEIHYGLIAQDVVEALEKFGVSEDDIAMIQKSENYSMLYNQLIPIIINALKETLEK